MERGGKAPQEGRRSIIYQAAASRSSTLTILQHDTNTLFISANQTNLKAARRKRDSNLVSEVWKETENDGSSYRSRGAWMAVRLKSREKRADVEGMTGSCSQEESRGKTSVIMVE